MPKDEKPPAAKQLQEWTPEEKFAIVLEAASLSEGEIGVFLRSKGLTTAVLDEWREQAITKLRGTKQVAATVVGSKRIKDLERELARMEKALARLTRRRAAVGRTFVRWYNDEHQHSGIGFVSPAARRRHPERWSGDIRTWSRPEVVILNPENVSAAAA